MSSPEATSIYSVSVDSRSRPANQPDFSYTIDLGRTLQRVKTIQLASIQIPDARYAFGRLSQMEYSEPITIAPDSYLFIQQTTTVLNKLTNVQTSSTNTVKILVPPTLNKITAYDVGTDTVTTLYPTGLDFGVNYYPLVGLNMSIVGGNFPQSIMTVPMPAPFPAATGPVLTTATVIQPYTGPSGLSNQYQYAAGYITALTSSAVNHDVRHIIPGTAYSYVYAPKPTLVELFTMLNGALNALVSTPTFNSTVTLASNTTPITVTTATNHGLHDEDQVTISGAVGNTGANGVFNVAVTGLNTFMLLGSVGNGVYVGGSASVTSILGLNLAVNFGFDDTKNLIVATAPTKIMDSRTTKITIAASLIGGNGTLSTLLGFGSVRLDPAASANVPPTILRNMLLRAGNYSPDQISSMLNVRMNPLVFQVPVVQRTMQFLLPGGTPYQIILPAGRYTATQITAFLNYYLNVPPANITVVYNANATFTFTQNFGLPFGLLFNNQNLVLLAYNFGFEPINYDQNSTYTSVNQAVFGVSAGSSFPENTYSVTDDVSKQHFNFDTGDLSQFSASSGTNTANVSAVWNPLYLGGQASDGIALSFDTGAILTAQNPFIFSGISGATNASPIVITSSGATALATGDFVTIYGITGNTAANGTWQVTVTAGNTFSLNLSTGNEAYISGGYFYTNSHSGVATNTFTVVVQYPWDASSGVGSPVGSQPVTLTLQPTASIFSTLAAGTVNQALQAPTTTNLILLQSNQRNVFQLLFSNPNAKPSNFGFPAISWPPSVAALQSFDSTYFPTFNAITQAVPVAGSYTSPYSWNLSPPDYILMSLSNVASDMNSHNWNGDSRPIFAKLQITSPYLMISENFLFNSAAGFDRLNQVTVTFRNPDWSNCEFNGRPHNFTMLFTLVEYSGNLIEY